MVNAIHYQVKSPSVDIWYHQLINSEVGHTHQEGALFKFPINEDALVAPSDVPCIFFTIQTTFGERGENVTTKGKYVIIQIEEEVDCGKDTQQHFVINGVEAIYLVKGSISTPLL